MEKERINRIIKLIEFFERTRALRVSDPKEFEKAWKEGRGIRGSRKRLKAIKKDYEKIVKEIKSSEKNKKLVKITSTLEVASFSLLALVLIISMMQFTTGLSLPPRLLQGVATAMVMLPSTFFFMRWYTEKKLKKLQGKRSAELENLRNHTKEAAQKLIHILGKEIERYTADPNAFKFKLYHNDYTGIKIIRRPGAFSPFYIVTVKAKSKR